MTYRAIALAVAAALSAGSAVAGSGTANFNVKLNVTGTCTFAGGGDLDFGTKSADEVKNGNLVTNEGKLNVKCTKGLPYTVAIGNGSNSDGSSRRMKNAAGDFVKYGLYQDTGTGSAWTATGLAQTSGTSNTANLDAGQDYKVYANILANANTGVAVGAYTDAVTATLTF